MPTIVAEFLLNRLSERGVAHGRGHPGEGLKTPRMAEGAVVERTTR